MYNQIEVVKELDNIAQHIGDLKRTSNTEQAYNLVEGGKYLAGAIYLGPFKEQDSMVASTRTRIRYIMEKLGKLHDSEKVQNNYKLKGVLLDAIATLKVELEGSY